MVRARDEKGKACGDSSIDAVGLILRDLISDRNQIYSNRHTSKRLKQVSTKASSINRPISHVSNRSISNHRSIF